MRWWLGGLALLALAAVLQLGLLAYAMHVFLVVLLISRAAARRWTDSVSVERECSVSRADIGDTADFQLTLRNESRRRVAWLVAEEGMPREAMGESPPRVRVQGPRLAVASLKGGESRTLQYRAEFLTRGYYPFGPTLLESGDWFGLHRRFRVAGAPHYVLVRPRALPLEGYDIASRRPVGEVRIRHRLFEDPTRINGVRPYQRGDPLNRIHWRATARTGSLQSKSYEPSRVAGATLLLDFHRDSFLSGRNPMAEMSPAARRALMNAVRADSSLSFEAQPDRPLVELAVTAVASLANAIQEMGEQVGFASNGRDAADRARLEGWGGQFRTRALARARMTRQAKSDRLEPVVVETRRGAEQLDRILDALARLELSDGMRFHEFLSEITPRLPRDASIVAVLARAPEETAFALGALRRRGFAVTVLS
jgi:uncharacterized protein (DUF58 family)